MLFDRPMKTGLVVLLVLLAGSLALSNAQAEPNPPTQTPEARLRDHLQALDSELRNRQEQALSALTVGGGAASEAARRSGAELSVHLEQLEILVRRGDFGAPAPWLERLAVLARKAARLERTARLDPAAARRELARLVPTATAVPPASRAGANETCATAQAIGGSVAVGSTAGARADGAFGSCGVSELSPDLWYRFTAPTEGTFYATTAGSSFDTVLSVYESCSEGAEPRIACSDNEEDSLQAALHFEAEAGETYFLRVSGFAGAAGAFRLGVGPGATIAGSVRSAGDGQPLPRVTVSLGAIGNTFEEHSAATAADGTFRVILAEPGSYWAATESTSGFGRQLYDRVDCASAGCDLEAATPIEVGASGAVGGIDFVLKRGGRLTGHVRSAAGGTPVADAQVTVMARGDIFGDETRLATTDANGEWVVDGLTPGGYYVWVEAAEHLAQLYPSLPCIRIFGRECSTQNAELITVEAEQTRGGIDFALLRGGAIAGEVVAATTGEPLAFVDVRVFDSSRNVVGSAVSDAAGAYEVGGLAAGIYRVTAEPITGSYLRQLYDRVDCDDPNSFSGCELERGRAVAVGEMTVTRGVDFALEVGGSLAGRAFDARTGFPIEFVSVELLNQAGDSVERERTGSDGRWRAFGLYPGRYRVIAHASEGYFDQVFEGVDCDGAGEPSCESASAATLITLGDGGGSVVDVDFALASKGSIAGRIVERASGAPIGSASVEVLDEGFEALEQANTDAAGFYLLQGLAPGRYRVKVDAPGYLTQLYDGVLCVGDPRQPCEESAGTRIDLGRSERREGIDFELRRAGVISGRVRAVRDGQPISDTEVTLYDARGSQVDSQDTDEEGRFTFRNLAPAGYRATAVASGFLAEIYDDVFCDFDEGECDPSLGREIPLGLEGTIDDLDFALDAWGVAAGRVIDATTGAGIAGARVMELDATGRSAGSRATTDGSGRYELLRVRPGGRFLAVEPPLGYLGEVFGGAPCERPSELGCSVAGATPVSVPLSGTTGGIDFALGPDAEIRARVVAERSGDPIASARVELFDAAGRSLGQRFTDEQGRVTIGGLLGGRYFARIEPSFSGGFFGELFDDLPCSSQGCEPTTGTPIEVAAGGSVALEAGLSALGEIRGTVRRAATGLGLDFADLSVYDEEGQRVTSSSSDADGSYVIGGLSPGRYFLVARGSDLLTQLWSGISCVLGSCDPTLGTALDIELDSTLTGVDFVLETGGLISGTVRDAFRGELSDFVGIELWSEGRWLGETFADSFGRWVFTGLTEGVYTVSTQSSGSYADQLWAGSPCPGGAPAGCDPASGTPIVLAEPTQARTGIDFELVPLAPAACGFRGLCLADERLEVEVSWRDFSGFGERAGAETLTDDAGYFWFLDDENVEMVAKVVDACAGPNPGFWFFAAGLTNFEVETKVTDLLTGEVKTYRNPLGRPFQPILDTNAFSFCTAAAAPRTAERPEPEPRLPKLFESCDPDEHVLCLNDGRFQVEAFYETFLGETGMAQAVELTEDAGYFWFFDDDNVEVVVKVLDGCFAAEPRFWVFAAGLTNVEVLLRVTDTETGAVKEYRNPLATPFQPILDTGAFATCP